MQQTAQQVETFTGVVENTIPHKDIGWVRTDTGETLFVALEFQLLIFRTGRKIDYFIITGQGDHCRKQELRFSDTGL